MGKIIGVGQQKGGVGKSTTCRALATEFASADWNVKIADMDLEQLTCVHWQRLRLSNQIQPTVAVEAFGTVNQALKAATHTDLLILDGGAKASQKTAEIAQASDLFIIPTGLTLDDLSPAVVMAHNLVKKHNVPMERIAFALCRTTNSKAALEAAKDYINSTGFFLLDGVVEEKQSYADAHNQGKSICEASHKTVKEKAGVYIQSIADRLTALTD